MTSRRVNTQELATMWKLTTARVKQFASAGRITRGPDGLFDLDQALAFRNGQIEEDYIRTMVKTVGTRSGTHDPKFTEHQAGNYLSADDVLGLEPENQAPQPALDNPLSAHRALAEARLLGEHEKLRRARLRNDREEGVSVLKSEVHKAGLRAAKTCMNVLDALPAELASIFADAETRDAVRRNVQQKIDQCLSILHKSIVAVARDSDDDE